MLGKRMKGGPAKRLVVLMHGSHGHAKDFEALSGALRSQFEKNEAPEHLTVFTPTACQGRSTDAGIDKVITVVTPSIEEQLKAFDDSCKQANTIGRVSFAGHSLGGVVLRGVFARLDRQGTLLNRDNGAYLLDTYVSVASPHLGVGHTSKTLQSVARWASRLLPSVAYADMLLDTHCLDLLAADPHADRGLSEFSRRILVAATGDHLVPPSSALVGTVTHTQLRALSRAHRSTPPLESALVAVDVADLSASQAKSTRETDLFSPLAANPQEKLAWEASTPMLDEQRRRRVVAISRMLKGQGRSDRFQHYVAVFPRTESSISHRAVIGKGPWNGKRLRPVYVTRLAQLLLGQS